MTEIIKKEEIKKVLCKHCNNTFLATKENFYTKKSKLALDSCKKCKCEKIKIYQKTFFPRPKRVRTRDRKEYNKAYYLKKKLEKEALKSNEI